MRGISLLRLGKSDGLHTCDSFVVCSSRSTNLRRRAADDQPNKCAPSGTLDCHPKEDLFKLEEHKISHPIKEHDLPKRTKIF